MKLLAASFLVSLLSMVLNDVLEIDQTHPSLFSLSIIFYTMKTI